jgi:glutamate---cysteine ligase / carboxylate-amine ligase
VHTESSGVTFGVEEEFLVVDNAGQLASAAQSVLGSVPETDDGLQPEMVACQVESATPVCTSVEELLDHLRRLRQHLSDGARGHGLQLVASGTPPLAEADPAPLTPDRRYSLISAHFRALLSNANICGCHVHVGVPDRVTGLGVLNHLRPWLPVLLAVSANSPLADGTDTGYASWRHILMSAWPSAGPPPYLESLDRYDATIDGMARSGALLDPAMVYWAVRLSPQYPTVEVRVCDVAVTAEEAALVGVLVRGLVVLALERIGRGEDAPRVPQDVVRADLWRAARDGLTGECAAPSGSPTSPTVRALHRLVGEVRPVLAPQEREFVDSMVRLLVREGDGATRQRAALARNGSTKDVIAMLAGRTMR